MKSSSKADGARQSATMPTVSENTAGMTEAMASRLCALIEAGSDFIYRMNADWTELLEIKCAKGSPHTELPVGKWPEAYIYPEDWPRVRAAIDEALHAQRIYEFEHRSRGPDGASAWMHTKAVPIFGPEGELVEWLCLASDITSRKEAQDQLKLATDGANVGIWIWDFATDRLQWSDRCKSMLSLALDAEPTLEYFWSVVHPDDREQLQKTITDATQQGGGFGGEFRVVQADGTVVWIKSTGNAYPVGINPPRGMGGIISDITQQKATELELERHRHHLEELVAERTKELAAAEAANQKLAARLQVATQAARLGIWSRSFSDNALEWNERMCEIYEAPKSLAKSHGYTDLWESRLHPDDWAVMRESKQKILHERRPVDTNFRIVLPGNRIRYIKSTSLTQFNAEGIPIGAVGTNEDVTEQVLAAQDLQESKQAAEAANLAKTKFLAAASHDLRQPLAAISLYLNALQGSLLDEKQRDLVGLLQAANEAQKQMLNSLLDVAKLDAGAVTPKFKAIAVADLFVWIEDTFWIEFREKHLGFSVTYPQGKLWLHSDETLLKTILRNLLVNALKYCRQGRILVSLRKRGKRALIQVWDTGIGMSAHHVKRIFEEFYQIGNEERDSAKGLGLGLSIVKRLSTLIGAEVHCRSRPGSGSVFEVWVPLLGAEHRPTDEVRAHPAGAKYNPALLKGLAGKWVTVIEDNPEVRKAMVIALAAAGIRVKAFTEADSALAAPDILQSDFYISDFRLPGPTNGVKLLLEIQRRKAELVKAVILTGETMIQDYPELRQCPWKVMIKPCDIRDLLAALTEPATA